MKRRWLATSVLLLPLLLLGCLPSLSLVSSSDLEQQIRLEYTVVAMQTDVAIELAELRELVSTPVTPPTSTPSPTSAPLIPTSTPTSVPPSPPGGTVTTDMLNMRSGPGLEYDVVAHLQKGDALEVGARIEASDWVKVSTAEGLEGWVAVEYVALNVPLDSIPLAVEIPPTPTPGPAVPGIPTAPVPPTVSVTPTATTIGLPQSASSEG